MEPALVAAYTRMLAAHLCSADLILEDPGLRAEFLDLAREALPGRTERDLLHGLTNLRKRGKLPRRLDLILW
jgi:hypothetical protein